MNKPVGAFLIITFVLFLTRIDRLGQHNNFSRPKIGQIQFIYFYEISIPIFENYLAKEVLKAACLTLSSLPIFLYHSCGHFE